jgi:misacylated tRNA(Ala) deacylase
MENPLYMEDSFLKEFDAEVKEVNDSKFIVLNNTAFYPNSGGQPHDTGIIKTESGDEYKVVFVGKFSGNISHEVDHEGLKLGDKVHCTLDWDRRYKLMRNHTAAHILSEMVHKETGALITGNQLNVDKSRIDFSQENYDVEKIKDCIQKSNEIIDKDLPIKAYFLPREEAMQLPQLTKLAKGLPDSIKEIRIVEIIGYDKQGDGGTHVKSLKEVGHLEFIKAENKGKNNRRVYFKLID